MTVYMNEKEVLKEQVYRGISDLVFVILINLYFPN